MTQLATLADVRALIDKHLPAQLRAKPHWRYVTAQLRAKPHWRYVTAQLKEAAEGADTADVAAALVIALALEGVQCRPRIAQMVYDDPTNHLIGRRSK